MTRQVTCPLPRCGQRMYLNEDSEMYRHADRDGLPCDGGRLTIIAAEEMVDALNLA